MELETRTVEASIEARIIRCGCGDPQRFHARTETGALLPCPTPRKEVDLGAIAYFNADPEKQAAFDQAGADARIAAANEDA